MILFPSVDPDTKLFPEPTMVAIRADVLSVIPDAAVPFYVDTDDPSILVFTLTTLITDPDPTILVFSDPL